MTRLNKEAFALANELNSVKRARHLEREAGRYQAKKVEQLQAVGARVAVLEAQPADSRTRLAEAEAEATVARADSASDELRQQVSVLEVELSAAKSARALDERLATTVLLPKIQQFCFRELSESAGSKLEPESVTSHNL